MFQRGGSNRKIPLLYVASIKKEAGTSESAQDAVMATHVLNK